MNTLTRKSPARATALASLMLGAAAWAPALLAREAPPAPAEPRAFALPAKDTVTLPNGLRITFIEYGLVPKVTLVASLRTGNIDDGGRTWLPDVVTEMLKEGTRLRSSATIARDAASMGGALSIGAGMDTTTASMSVLSEFATDAAGMLGEVLRQPLLPESELARIKANFERNRSISVTEPGSIAGAAFASMVYGDHPYGRRLPTAEQLAGYTIADVRKFYADNFGARRTTIYVAGRYDRKALEAALRKAFGDWQAGPRPARLVRAPVQAAQSRLIDRPAAPQSTVRLGLPVADASQPDYLPLALTNTLLGGSFASRITSNIREQKGYTYSPSGSVSNFYRVAQWMEAADVTSADTAAALAEIYKEVDRLRNEPPTAEELAGFQRYMAGLFVIRNSSPNGVLSQVAFLDLHGLPDSFLTNYVQNVYAVSPAQVSAMAQKWIDPSKMTLVVVGDLATVGESVRKLPQLAGAAER